MSEATSKNPTPSSWLSEEEQEEEKGDEDEDQDDKSVSPEKPKSIRKRKKRNKKKTQQYIPGMGPKPTSLYPDLNQVSENSKVDMDNETDEDTVPSTSEYEDKEDKIRPPRIDLEQLEKKKSPYKQEKKKLSISSELQPNGWGLR